MDLGVIQTSKHLCKTQLLIFRGFFLYDIGWHTDPVQLEKGSADIITKVPV